MSDQAVILPKWFPHGRIILAKGQLDHSYTLWTMAKHVFQPSSKFCATVSIVCINFKFVRRFVPSQSYKTLYLQYWGIEAWLAYCFVLGRLGTICAFHAFCGCQKFTINTPLNQYLTRRTFTSPFAKHMQSEISSGVLMQTKIWNSGFLVFPWYLVSIELVMQSGWWVWSF